MTDLNEQVPLYTPPFDWEEWLYGLEITPEVVLVIGIVVVLLWAFFGPIKNDNDENHY